MHGQKSPSFPVIIHSNTQNTHPAYVKVPAGWHFACRKETSTAEDGWLWFCCWNSSVPNRNCGNTLSHCCSSSCPTHRVRALCHLNANFTHSRCVALCHSTCANRCKSNFYRPPGQLQLLQTSSSSKNYARLAAAPGLVRQLFHHWIDVPQTHFRHCFWITDLSLWHDHRLFSLRLSGLGHLIRNLSINVTIRKPLISHGSPTDMTARVPVQECEKKSILDRDDDIDMECEYAALC